MDDARLAHASLGGEIGILQAESQGMGLGAFTAQQTSNYTVYEMAPKKFKLHEFAGPNGVVFALAWCGKARPDLQAVFGSHLEDFKNAIKKVKSGPHGRRGAIVDLDSFHLELSSRGGSSCGRAWLTDQIPSGVTTDELR